MRPVQSCLATVLSLSILSVPCAAQEAGAEGGSSNTVDGAVGLFSVWDAEPLRSGQIQLGVGVNRYNRDPGQLRVARFPVAGALGVLGFMEVFAALDVQK